MSENHWPERFEQVLRPHLALIGDKPMTSDTSLADAGLDSLSTVSLLIELEEVFAVVVPDERLTAETFATAGGLWATLADLGGGRG